MSTTPDGPMLRHFSMPARDRRESSNQESFGNSRMDALDHLARWQTMPRPAAFPSHGEAGAQRLQGHLLSTARRAFALRLSRGAM